jgi:DNA repair protein SbcD/Mre11
MRFLHTADWHVGKTLRTRSRMDEFERALGEVARIAIEGRVDAVLVAGDIFDSPAPPPEAERLVYDFLARLLPERIACVLIAGNHDHPRKLAALARLLDGLRIYVRHEVRPPGQGGVVSVPSRDGSEEARVAVLPFVPERKIVDACSIMQPEYTWYEAYSGRIEQILRHLTAGFTPATVNLLLAHLLIDGARVGTGERPLHLGEIYGVNAQQVPANIQYVGLGHLHRPQELMAPSKTCYSGSLIELDFGEREQDKCVVMVEARPGQAAKVDWVPLNAGRRLRDVEGTLAELQAMAPEVGDDFLRVRVRADGPVPGIADQVRDALPNAIDVSVAYKREVPEEPAVSRLQQLRPAELFGDFFRQKNGVPPAPELMQLFENVYEEARNS